jgi:hypothetical protein
MIPKFIEIEYIGYLPEGIYECTLDELENTFGKSNEKRKKLFAKLLEFIHDIKSIGCDTLFIDGSFITTKELPKDIDVLWDYEGIKYENFKWESIELKLPIIFNRYERELKYKLDIFPAKLEEGASGKLFLDFFQQIKETNLKKGIIKIKL